MTETELFYLKCLRYAIESKKITELPEGIDYKVLYGLASRHAVTALLFCTLKDILEKTPKQFALMLKKSFSRQTMFDSRSNYDCEVVIEELKKNKIRFLPLKGYFLKQMYQSSVMRFASDRDILVDRENLKKVNKIMLSLGYKKLKKTEHHDVYCNPITRTVFEFHKKIFVGFLEKYFGIGFERAVKSKNDDFTYELPANDYYISVVAHYAYHFYVSGGVGIRSIIDLRVMDNFFKERLDKNYISLELERCKILKFYEEMEKVVKYTFDNESVNDFTLKLLNYIFESSYLDNEKNSATNLIVKSGNKKKAFFNIIFPPKRYIYFTYPFIKKCKVLLPIGYVIRWLRVLFKTPSNLSKFTMVRKADEKSLKLVNEIKSGLGL